MLNSLHRLGSLVVERLMRLTDLANPRWWRFHRQRWVTNLSVRCAAGQAIASRQPRSSGGLLSDALAKHGMVMLPALPPTVSEDLASEIIKRSGWRPTSRGQLRSGRGTPVKPRFFYIEESMIAHIPAVAEIANRPSVLAIVAEFLGCKPTIAHMSAWWSLPTSAPGRDAQLWHRDVDDYLFLKAFYYLTDVDEESGPFGIVRGSHHIEALQRAGARISDQLIEQTFKRDDVLRLTGPAGTCFLANTYAIHRGYPPKARPRLMLQILYAQRPLIYSPSQPIVAGCAGDPWTNRLYYRLP